MSAARRGFLKALLGAAGVAPLVLGSHEEPAPGWISPDTHFRWSNHEDGSMSVTFREVGGQAPRLYLKQVGWAEGRGSTWDLRAECGDAL